MRTLPRLARLFFPVAWRGCRHERRNQPMGSRGDFLDGLVEYQFVCPGGAIRSAHLPDKLQRRRTNFLVGCRRRKVRERLDVAAHGSAVSLPMKKAGRSARPAHEPCHSIISRDCGKPWRVRYAPGHANAGRQWVRMHYEDRASGSHFSFCTAVWASATTGSTSFRRIRTAIVSSFQICAGTDARRIRPARSLFVNARTTCSPPRSAGNPTGAAIAGPANLLHVATAQPARIEAMVLVSATPPFRRRCVRQPAIHVRPLTRARSRTRVDARTTRPRRRSNPAPV